METPKYIVKRISCDAIQQLMRNPAQREPYDVLLERYINHITRQNCARLVSFSERNESCCFVLEVIEKKVTLTFEQLKKFYSKSH